MLSEFGPPLELIQYDRYRNIEIRRVLGWKLFSLDRSCLLIVKGVSGFKGEIYNERTKGIFGKKRGFQWLLAFMQLLADPFNHAKISESS